MSEDDILHLIGTAVNRRLREREHSPVSVLPGTRLSGEAEVPVDSLDLAVIILELQEEVGVDPFEMQMPAFDTVGELAGLFHRESLRTR